eukprot:m.75572 g.75572  ORF g.75572 m.75572 type:complete len:140 (+) comp18969_c0_seq4:1412-1831(+)
MSSVYRGGTVSGISGRAPERTSSIRRMDMGPGFTSNHGSFRVQISHITIPNEYTSVSGPPADGVLEVLPFNSSGAIHSVVPTVGLMSSGLRSLIADADISKGDTSLTSPADGTSRSVDESWFKGWLTGLNELLCLALVD